jgi:hypothetical protein
MECITRNGIVKGCTMQYSRSSSSHDLSVLIKHQAHGMSIDGADIKMMVQRRAICSTSSETMACLVCTLHM